MQQDSYFNDDSYFAKDSNKLRRQPSFKTGSTAKPSSHGLTSKVSERSKKLKLENKIGTKVTTLKDMEAKYNHVLTKLSKSTIDLNDAGGEGVLSSRITADHQEYNDRLTWQMMLTRVLTGDIVTKEKSKLEDLKENAMIVGTDGIGNGISMSDEIGNGELSKNKDVYTKFKGDLWLELKAWMNGQVLQEHEKTLDILRNSVADYVFEALMEDDITRVAEFKDEDEKFKIYFEKMNYKIENYEKVTSYWANLKDMHQDKPLTISKPFLKRVHLFHSWINSANSINSGTDVISKHS